MATATSTLSTILGHPVTQSLVAIASSLLDKLSLVRGSEWVSLAVAALASAALVQSVRVATADADLATLRALRNMPRLGAFTGKVVMITGASSGIGEAVAYEFARGGATLILCARRVPELLKVVERCLAEGAAGAEALKLDVCATETHADLVAHILRKHPGGVTHLWSNAGRSQRAVVEETPLAVDRELFETNVFGLMSLTKALLVPTLAAGRGLHLINTSSVAGKVGAPCSATYSATKFAVQGWSEALFSELGSRGVVVTNICPGPVDSEISLHSVTHVPGAKLGAAAEPGSARMKTARCAELAVAAVHARLPESWISGQPILLFVYIAQYTRGLYTFIGPRLGAKRVAGFRTGNTGYSAVRGNPFSLVFGSTTSKEKAV